VCACVCVCVLRDKRGGEGRKGEDKSMVTNGMDNRT
jgi:hypothetical protein